ncbi:MAG: Methyltransferase type 11 [Parcubacteria group bacterium Athens0714_12]|nr:MAG: Methyltransferase type 11 [Parcubacteria group bacterium Athens0714_12]
MPLNSKLLEIADNVDSHFFLKNPAGQNIFIYLIEYVKNFSEYWFDKNLGQLKILDWGCGKGQVSFLLKENGAKAVSCDIKIETDDSSFGQETPIIKKAGIEVIPLKHEYVLPFQREEFDVVLSFGVLEHTSNDLESLKEINRILKPSGLFFCFNLPYFLSWTQRLSHLLGNFYHHRLYSKKLTKNLLNKSGFNLIDIWRRQLFPKNTVKYPEYHLFESLDQFLTNYTFLKYFATNIEFVAEKRYF